MEFNLMEEWDLQAVARGCSSTSNFSNYALDFDEILSFCDDRQNGFYYSNSTTALSPQSNLSISTCLLSSEEQENELQKQRSSSDSSRASAKSTKRKNQQKRVVKHVAEDDISSDKWTWRKYGQKPIKGSPFPRSYYRCSSLKGCMGKKQVERSIEDPSIFVLTYTNEHCHPHPTRRNSLAGTSRIKDPNLAKHTLQPNQKLVKPKISKMDTIPNPPITPNSEDNLVHHVIGSIKNEQLEDEEIRMSDMIFTEDLFPSLDDCEGLFLDRFSATVP